MTSRHAHSWTLAIHLDGCHEFSSSYTCDCGAVRSVGAERDFRHSTGDPYSSLWALPDCDRCRELMAGARRRPRWDRTLEAGGLAWIRTPK